MRTIKPEFWRDEKIKQQSREHRLLLAGLYSYVDDNGVGLDDYRQIAADLFALEDDPMEVREFVREGLARLSRGFLITRYTVSGVAYLYVNGWSELQKIDKPNKARFPLPSDEAASVPCDDEDPRGALAGPSRDPREGPSPGTGEQGNRGTGENPPCSPPAGDTKAPRKKQGARLPEDFTVTGDMRKWAAEKFPNVDLDYQTEKFRDHWRASSGSNAVKRDWVAAWRTWIRNASERSSSRPPPTNGYRPWTNPTDPSAYEGQL